MIVDSVALEFVSFVFIFVLGMDLTMSVCFS